MGHSDPIYSMQSFLIRHSAPILGMQKWKQTQSLAQTHVYLINVKLTCETDRQTVSFFSPRKSWNCWAHQGLWSPQPSRQITAISRCIQHEDLMLKSSADNSAHERYKIKLFSILNSASAIQSTFFGMHTLHVCSVFMCSCIPYLHLWYWSHPLEHQMITICSWSQLTFFINVIDGLGQNAYISPPSACAPYFFLDDDVLIYIWME